MVALSFCSSLLQLPLQYYYWSAIVPAAVDVESDVQEELRLSLAHHKSEVTIYELVRTKKARRQTQRLSLSQEVGVVCLSHEEDPLL